MVTDWWRKVKELRQVLCEQDWINKHELHKYKIIIRDEDGNMVPKYYLFQLLENCIKNEMSQLEYVCEGLRARAVITTKYHAEYTSEGIKYTWGLFKLYFCWYPIECM